MSLLLYNRGYRPLSQIAVFLGVWGACFIAAAIASFAIAFLGGMSLGSPDSLLQASNAPTLRIMQAVSTLFIFGMPAILYAFICFSNGWQVVGLQRGWDWRMAGLAVAIILSTGPLTDTLGELNKSIPLPASFKSYFDSLEKQYEDQVKIMLDVKSAGGLIGSLLLIAGLPALFEELFFRGAVQGMLTRWWRSPWVAILVTSLIFSAIHFSWYGFIPRIMLGVVLGVVYYITGNLWYSILMHFVNNGAAVLYMYWLHTQGKSIDISNTSIFPAWVGLIALSFIFFLIRVLAKIKNPEVAEEKWINPGNPFDPTFERDTDQL